MRYEDLTGKTFGRWTVIARNFDSKRRYPVWRCKCSCGKEKHEIPTSTLKEGASQSCGCLRKEIFSYKGDPNLLRSGSNPLWVAYTSMKTRCYNSKHPTFRNYGARGIEVCDRWLASFDNFVADVGARPPGTSLDRIDYNGDYSPENCRWAGKLTQAANRRNSIIATWKGREMCLTEVARMEGINYQVLYLHYRPKERNIEAAVEHSRKKSKVHFKERASILTSPHP